MFVTNIVHWWFLFFWIFYCNLLYYIIYNRKWKMRCWIQQSTKLKRDYFDLMYATCSLGELGGETFAEVNFFILQFVKVASLDIWKRKKIVQNVTFLFIKVIPWITSGKWYYKNSACSEGNSWNWHTEKTIVTIALKFLS